MGHPARQRREWKRGRRQAWLALHKWTGLVLGGALALIGLTGSAIVLYREVDVWLNPSLFVDVAADVPASAVLKTAMGAMPDPVIGVAAPDPIWPVWTAYRMRDGHLWTTTIDRAGHVLGSRDYDRSFAMLVYHLHSDLLLQPWWGEQMVGVLGLVLLLSAGSGLYLWWPRTSFWRACITVRRRPLQILFLDLHNVAGAWASLCLIVVAMTGVGLVFPALIRPLVGIVSRTELLSEPTVPGRAGPYLIDIDRAVAAVQAIMPGAEPAYIQLPQPPGNPWTITLRWPNAGSANRGTLSASVDPWSGETLQPFGPATATMGERYLRSQLWIHNGSLLGWPGRVLVFFSGLSLPVLFVTGVLFWLRKRRARRLIVGQRRSNGPVKIGRMIRPSITP